MEKEDEDDYGSSFLLERHKILGLQVIFDELNSNSLTLPPLHCDHNAQAEAQDQSEPKKKEIVFSNVGNWKPI